MKKLIQILFGIFLFIFPFSFRFLVYEQASYRFGNFNPWVTGFVYLPEILLGVVFILWLINKIQNSKIKTQKSYSWLWVILSLFVLNAYVITYLNGDAVLGAIFVLRVFEALVIFWLISDEILQPKQVISVLLFGAFVQILWGYVQWRTNHSLGLTLLGESALGSDVLGVAKVNLAAGVKQIRAYGSFLHPNIFAAYLLIIFFLGSRYLKYGYKLFWLALFAWGIYLTHSRAAMLVGAIALGLYFLFGIFRSISLRKTIALVAMLLLVIVNFWFFQKSHDVNVRDAAVAERLSQNVISQNMWQENSLGVGASNFTLKMESFALDKLSPWEFQPVHNTYFLILNEVGVQGLILLIIFFLVLFDIYWKAGKAIPVFVLLFLAPFDHFLWDSFAGVILIGLVAGFFVVENHKEGAIEHVVDIVTHQLEED